MIDINLEFVLVVGYGIALILIFQSLARIKYKLSNKPLWRCLK